MAKYYLCEGNESVEKVTLFESANDALDAAEKSNEKVHFISTVNPLEGLGEGKENE